MYAVFLCGRDVDIDRFDAWILCIIQVPKMTIEFKIKGESAY